MTPKRFSPLLVVATTVLVLAGIAQSTALDAPPPVRADCQVGNPVPPVPPSVPDFVTGQQEYTYLVYPPDNCSCPDGGVQFEAISMLLEIQPHQIPVQFAAVATVREAVLDEQSGCYVPGDEICVSDPMAFLYDEPGYQEVRIPTPTCECVLQDEHYFIGIRFLDPFLADLPVDDQPQGCISYLSDPNGQWIDLDTRGGRPGGGKVIVWGDLICCDPAVPGDATNWSRIKAIYR